MSGHLLLRRTRRFFPSGGRNHRNAVLILPTLKTVTLRLFRNRKKSDINPQTNQFISTKI